MVLNAFAIFASLLFLSTTFASPQNCASAFEPMPRTTLSIAPTQGEWSAFGGTSYSDLALTMPRRRDDLEALKQILVQGGSDRKTVDIALDRAFASEQTSVSLKKVSPHFVRLMTGIAPKGANGIRECPTGNCWNATLNWFDAETGIFPAKSEDMEHSLDTYFTPLAADTGPRFGDVMVVRSGPTLIHTATYITDQFVWNKLAVFDEAPFEFRRTDDMMLLIEKTFRNVHVSYRRKKTRDR